jgi:hypothetical protein
MMGKIIEAAEALRKLEDSKVVRRKINVAIGDLTELGIKLPRIN